MSSSHLRAGESATVTFTFSAAPFLFTADNVSVTNGTISDFTVTGDPKVYTATFTPTALTEEPTNSIRITPNSRVIPSVGNMPYGIAYDGTNMWAVSTNLPGVSKITPSGEVTNYTIGGINPYAIAFDGTNMWITSIAGDSVKVIDPTGTEIHSYSMGYLSGPFGIAFDGTNMWTANGNDSVSKITPDGDITNYPGTGSAPTGIAFDGTNMWTANQGGGVSKITPDGVITNYSGTGSDPQMIAFDGTNMWTTNGDSSVSKIVPDGTITNYNDSLRAPGLGIAFDGTNMWIADRTFTAVRYDPSGVQTRYTYGTVGVDASGIAFDGTNMWITDDVGNDVTEIGPIDTHSENYVVDTYVSPTVTTDSASSIGTSTATFQGSITAVGQANATLRGFHYGTTTSYGSDTPAESGSFGVDAFSASVSGLTCSTLYHYQAYATNNGGTGTGTDQTFTTAMCSHGSPMASGGGSGGIVPSIAPVVSPVVPTAPTVSTPTTPEVPTRPSSSSASHGPVTFTRTLTIGSSGSDVVQMQKILIQNGDLSLPVGVTPGYFGILTKKAVEQFQDKNAIVPVGAPGSGIVGPKTRAKFSGL